MFLSNRDLRWAISCGQLIVEPEPEKIGPTLIDLHLDRLSQAKVWDIAGMKKSGKKPGARVRR